MNHSKCKSIKVRSSSYIPQLRQCEKGVVDEIHILIFWIFFDFVYFLSLHFMVNPLLLVWFIASNYCQIPLFGKGNYAFKYHFLEVFVLYFWNKYIGENLRVLSQPQERFAPKFNRNQEKIWFFFRSFFCFVFCFV